MTRRVLLVGATGVFGSRLAAMLAGMPRVELVLAARGIVALEGLRDALLAANPAASVSVSVFDRRRPEALPDPRPWLVVDASGPFQESGYALALAAVGSGAHYVDLADARDFVAGFVDVLDAAATEAGVMAVTGASSTPALSHAAAARLKFGWDRLDAILVAISPGARAPRGLSVVQAILSYVGRPVRVFSGGAWGAVPGWSGLRRLDMPGLGRRWASICETPDLDLLPQRFPVRREALFMAGLEVAPMHLGLAVLGWLVRLGLLTSVQPLARPLRILAGGLAPFGSDRGGMIVEARGLDEDGRPIVARWGLWAEADAGPSTPAAPAAALVRALGDDRPFTPGAVAGAGVVCLEDILRELSGQPISTRIDEAHPEEPGLFRRLLGRRFATLPPAVRAVHGGAGPATFRGSAVTRSGRSVCAVLLRRLLGLPGRGRCPVTVEISPDGVGEAWTRRFGRARFASRLVGSRRLGVFEERIGPLRFAFRLEPTSRGVCWRLVGWRLASCPLPMALAPETRARSEEIDGRYRFRVAVAHPWTGLLFAYRGILA